MTTRLKFDVEKLDNGYLVNVQYQPQKYTDSEFKNYFFETLEQVKECYATYLAKLAE